MSKSFLTTITPSAYRVLLSTSNPTKRVIPIDATWFMPNDPKNAKQEFIKERIPGSKFFDLDYYIDKNSLYPHMLPKDLSIIEQIYSNLNLNLNDSLVIYDKLGIFSSPRIAWTFSLFGHNKVYLLDNYLNYKQSQYPLDKNPPPPEQLSPPQAPQQLSPENQNDNDIVKLDAKQFKQNYKQQVIEYEELLQLIENKNLKDYLLLDARSLNRFIGKINEPRPGLSSGHIPGAINLPFNSLLKNNSTKQFKSKQEIINIFQTLLNNHNNNHNHNNHNNHNNNNNRFDDLIERKIYPKGIIVMCGTGVTAVILKFAIECILKLNLPVRVYDGSWTEWASRAPSEYIQKDV
ncbi:thiosulfate sulfurtransferase, putative [Candida dubliniensis CD36]|uniref:Sulfurtransferase n=1 Tax=Candida dubliniensis (strain CD36 / ATCC MYA-646 / CBS 7987 / NCPF 3949 / NRRL Y-17841) TaxID=573826 RepID=B9WCR0_CANDC|nr:thiosulfate sulfurtransferase, putative [Candida dubliniensis CD36]CAX44183.1 thiosulfate sulfurtransferase, putative [Candida dubliniensis CD36]